jgi:hypothetical protein
LVMSLPIRRSPGALMNVSVWEHRIISKILFKMLTETSDPFLKVR